MRVTSGRRWVGVGVVLTALVCAQPVARAGGFDIGPRGARAEGRGGAVTAGTDSPIAIFHDPAQLATIHRYRLVGAINLNFPNVCLRRLEASDNDPAPGSVGDPLPQVCDSGPPSPAPTLALSVPLMDELTLGVGVEVPTNVFKQKWGPHDGNPGPGTGAESATPTSWILIESNLALAFASFAVAYAPHPRFRIGATFGWGVAIAKLRNSAYAFNLQSLNDIEARDYFVPKVTVGAHATPVDGLDLGVVFHWADTIHTENTDVTIEVPNFPRPGQTERIAVDGVLDVPLNADLSFGVRYAHALDAPADEVGDRLSTERWDLEADIEVLFNDRFHRIFLDLPDDLPGLAMALPDDFSYPQHWKTQYAVRVGGDYNPIPGLLGLRAGFSYETSGVEHGYEQLFFLPLERYGVHVGATVRIDHRFDVSLAYAHFFQPTVFNAVTEARLPSAAAPEDASFITNAGTLRSHYDVLAVEGAYTF